MQLPLASAAVAELFVDFCRRAHNVNGRAASVRLAFRKAICPNLLVVFGRQMLGVVELLSAARTLGCGMLTEQCCSFLADNVRRRAKPGDTPWFEELEGIVDCEVLRAALVVDVFLHMIESDGEEATKAVAAATSVAWIVKAAQQAVAARADATRRAREAQTQREHLGLGMNLVQQLDDDLGLELDRPPAPKAKRGRARS